MEVEEEALILERDVRARKEDLIAKEKHRSLNGCPLLEKVTEHGLSIYTPTAIVD